MKLIHTADLHLGQIIYRHYERADEHDHFFRQLSQWCAEEHPDALLLTGDIFDIQQPSAATWRRFTDHFVALHHRHPDMKIILLAGNHDSPSRLHAHRAVWREIGTEIVALPPAADIDALPAGWEEDYVVSLPAGYVVAIPFMAAERPMLLQHLLDYVAERNTSLLPVVMTGHLAVTGCDVTGHDFDIGRIRTTPLDRLGQGYDYLALGHIHHPQTLLHTADALLECVSYPAPVARYSGSALHVSCDETYPHSVSVVEIPSHGGMVTIRQRRIEQLRHFLTIPPRGETAPTDAEEALAMLETLAMEAAGSGAEHYVRFRLPRAIWLPSDFNQRVYDIIARHGDHLGYNPKIDWCGADPAAGSDADADATPQFEVAELQQMTDPLQFIEQTIDRYPGLDLDMMRSLFTEIRKEVEAISDSPAATPDSPFTSSSSTSTPMQS
ncbi:MAG: exonuclease subunit SbcD [Muribaculaceae bacterium]|nr:exonuclease subunit SbcD [Muribaculaceae bacterium]